MECGTIPKTDLWPLNADAQSFACNFTHIHMKQFLHTKNYWEFLPWVSPNYKEGLSLGMFM